MVSKIIKLEKERQDINLIFLKNSMKNHDGSTGNPNKLFSELTLESAKGLCRFHKQSLINLLEHFEEDLILLGKLRFSVDARSLSIHERINWVKGDIEKLNRLIKNYE